MTSKVTDIEEYTDFSVLKHPKVMLTVRYQTDKGTQGSLIMPKDGATQESILKAVSDDAARVHGVVGQSTK